MEFLIDISTFIHIATIGVSLLLAAIISKRKSYYKKGNHYLLLSLASIVIIHTNASLILSGYDQNGYYVQNLSNAFILVFAPSIYLSILNRSGDVPSKKIRFLHFLPFFLYTAVVLLGFTGPNSQRFLEKIEPAAFLMFVIQIPTYIIISLRTMKRDKSHLFAGLRILLIGMLVTYIVQMGIVATEIFVIELSNAITVNASLPFSFCVIAFAYHCLSNDKVLFDQPKYAKSSMTEDQAKVILKNVIVLMEDELLYTNPDLKIGELADRLDITAKQISQAINDSLNQNFIDFINAYRVKHVAGLVKDPANENYTLLAVAELGGFKSGSVFNAAFKKHMGVLPSEYRKSYLNKPTA